MAPAFPGLVAAHGHSVDPAHVLSLLGLEKTLAHRTVIETGVGSDHGRDGLQDTEEEKGIPSGALGLNLPGQAALELNVEEQLGLLHTDSEEKSSRGQAQPEPRPRGRKASDTFGDWPFFVIGA